MTDRTSAFVHRHPIHVQAMTTHPLGEAKEIRLAQGVIRYRDVGSGPVVVFVHGLLVNGLLWRKVVPRLSGLRCVVPDWPLGSHELPLVGGADVSPGGVARLIADFLVALELEDVTLVGNDSGGAICQLVVTRHPERIRRLVLTPCDAYENFLPPMFRYLQWLARVPGGAVVGMQMLRVPALRRLPIAFGWLSKRPLERAVSDAYVAPILRDAGVRRDTTAFLRGIDKRDTLAAAARFGEFAKPVLIAWAPEDRFFPLAHAERMAAAFPHARLETIADSRTFVPEDQPERLASLIADFVREPAPA
jgi:pimeloyl-ACP methyl ester carboxylesterase